MRQNQLQKDLLIKRDLLNRSREILKNEFAGIDGVIDEVIDSVSSWYLFPLLQEKPVVLNLWGLTGVGKSSLVKRLPELLRLEERFFHFDLGERDTQHNNLKHKLELIYENANGAPAIIVFDEFQYARTVDESSYEVSNPASRVIWQLLDSGKFNASDHSYRYDSLYEMILNLRHMLKNGVKVSKGKVITKRKYFLDNTDNFHLRDIDGQFYCKKEPKDISFVPSYYHDAICRMARNKFETSFEVAELLNTLGGQQTIEFLTEVYEFAKLPRVVDCTKALIFVLGNLDEAYRMSNNFNPDIEADEFHEQSLGITVPVIKRALRSRFRNEQIARLGNNHIIYPAFRKETFRMIIRLELERISSSFEKLNGTKLTIKDSLSDLIYSEGVYPTQGTRPVYTTISRIISAKLGTIVSEMILRNIRASKISMAYENGCMNIEYIKGSRTLHKLAIKQELMLEKLRENKCGDTQAIAAVHESGHAVIASVLLGTVPEYILTTSAESGKGGLVSVNLKWDFISRSEILSRLAFFLGGFAAEKIVFGEANMTTGAEDDIDRATNFAMEMLKKCGMGELPASYHAEHPETRLYLVDSERKLDLQAEILIGEAMKSAEAALKSHRSLLLKMADHLSDNRSMNKKEIISFLELYGNVQNASAISALSENRGYRELLKNMVSSEANESSHERQMFVNMKLS